MGVGVNQDSIQASVHGQVHGVRARLLHSVSGQGRSQTRGDGGGQTHEPDHNGGRRQEHGQEETGRDKHGQMGGRKRIRQTEADQVQGGVRRTVVPQRQT